MMRDGTCPRPVTPQDVFEASTHEVARLVRREQPGREFADLLARAPALADRQPTDRKTVEIHLRKPHCAFPSQLPEKAHLHDPEHRLRRNPSRSQTPRRPAVRTAGAALATASSAVDGTHWSSAIMMSLPIATCAPMLTSGLNKIERPSV